MNSFFNLYHDFSRVYSQVCIGVALCFVSIVCAGQGVKDTLDTGVFEVQARESIQIYYAKPKQVARDTQVILVVPGAGRNAADYRDAWLEAAHTYNLLVLAPAYPEAQFSFSQYHMGGVIDNFSMVNAPKVTPRAGGRTLEIDDKDIVFTLQHEQDQWLFRDFDTIFLAAKQNFGFDAKHYDAFGHSAGGQILHRMAIFYPGSLAKRLVAANSGFYTLPNSGVSMPFGIQGYMISKAELKESFSTSLTLLLGELDNHAESRGTLLLTPKANLQGPGRFERGHFFLQQSQKVAENMHADFNWQIQVVPKVGHEYIKMSQYAAKFLYYAPTE